MAQDPTPSDSPGASAWVRKGVWAVADQALFAGANFVVNILLARWLTPDAYGAYTVAFTVFLLISVVHQGVLTEPMLVFGTERFRGRLAAYLGVVVRGHGVVTGVGVAVMALAALAVWLAGGPAVLAVGLLAIGVGQVGILLTWLSRSTSYVTFEPQRSAQAGALYAALLLGGTALLYSLGWLGDGRPVEVALAIGVMAGAGLVAGLWLLRRAGVWPLPPADDALRAEALAAHRGYGPWAAASGGLDWLTGYLPVLWLSAASGLAEAGALRALYNLALPALHVFQALGTLLVPLLVRAVAQRRGPQTVALLAALAFGGSLLYLGALVVGGGPLLHALYDGKFDGYADAMGLLGLIPLGIGVVVVLLSALRALERPRALFAARVVALAAVVLPVLVLGGVESVRGAILMIVALEVASALALGALTVHAFRQRPETEPASEAEPGDDAPGDDGLTDDGPTAQDTPGPLTDAASRAADSGVQWT